MTYERPKTWAEFKAEKSGESPNRTHYLLERLQDKVDDLVRTIDGRGKRLSGSVDSPSLSTNSIRMSGGQNTTPYFSDVTETLTRVGRINRSRKWAERIMESPPSRYEVMLDIVDKRETAKAARMVDGDDLLAWLDGEERFCLSQPNHSRDLVDAYRWVRRELSRRMESGT